MIEEKDPSSFKDARPQFSTSLVPLRVFIMRTHLEQSIGESVRERMAKDLPEEIINKILANLEKAGNKEVKEKLQGSIEELHALVLAKETSDESQECLCIFAAQVHRHGTGEWHEQDCKQVQNSKDDEAEESGLLMNYLLNLMNYLLNIERIQLEPNWKGKRTVVANLEAESHEDMLEKLQNNGALKDFLVLFPETITNDNPVSAAIPSPSLLTSPLTPMREKELIKRFGKANIQKLKDDIAKKNAKNAKRGN